MIDTLQQMALVDSLLLNWDAILMRIGVMSSALSAQFVAIGGRLSEAATTGDTARVIDDLLDLTRETAAGSYVRDLVRRASLSTEKMRGPGAVTPLSYAPETTSGLADRVQEGAVSLGESMIQTAALPLGVESAPVFFATNRMGSDASGKQFGGEVADALCFGLATVTVPIGIHRQGQLERPKWWKLYTEDPKESFLLSDVSCLPQSEFATRLGSATLRTNAQELLIFLHGFNVTFEEAALRAAQFAIDSDFQGVIVLFSWPSEGSVFSYLTDEEHAFSSGDKLFVFLKGLEKGPWKKVHLLAHSMGSRVLLTGLADNYPRAELPFGQLVFAAADVYVPMFNEKFVKLQGSGKLATTSYESSKDRALLLSSILHRGERVGLVDETPYVTENLESIDASAVDKGFLGHGYWSSQTPLLADLQSLVAGGLTPLDRKLRQLGKYWAFPTVN